MKRALFLPLLLVAATLLLSGCGGYNSSTTGSGSGLKDRAFFTENVSNGSVTAGVYIVDASKDARPSIAPISVGNTPGMMWLTPNRTQTLVFSPAEAQLNVIQNSTEAVAGHITLPGFTESVVVTPDSTTAYAAVPTAAVVGQSPGAIKAFSLSTGSFTAEIDIPSVHYLAIANSGNRILAFSDNSDSVAVITPSNLGTVNSAVTVVAGFDRPVAAFFSSDDTTAYVVNCGAECGGATASVQQLDLTTNTLGSYVAACTSDPTPQCAGSVALVDGSTMYLAGTPYIAGVPSQPCPSGATLAATCGLLTVVDLTSMTVTSSGIVITDGYHNRMALGANGQLFIGARTCTEIIPVNAGDEVRGCLSIYNTQTSSVVIPPANGEVTGIQPIAKRAVVYVVQDGGLGIYDTTTDKLQSLQITNLVGQFVDVITPDF